MSTSNSSKGSKDGRQSVETSSFSEVDFVGDVDLSSFVDEESTKPENQGENEERPRLRLFSDVEDSLNFSNETSDSFFAKSMKEERPGAIGKESVNAVHEISSSLHEMEENDVDMNANSSTRYFVEQPNGGGDEAVSDFNDADLSDNQFTEDSVNSDGVSTLLNQFKDATRNYAEKSDGVEMLEENQEHVKAADSLEAEGSGASNIDEVQCSKKNCDLKDNISSKADLQGSEEGNKHEPKDDGSGNHPRRDLYHAAQLKANSSTQQRHPHASPKKSRRKSPQKLKKTPPKLLSVQAEPWQDFYVPPIVFIASSDSGPLPKSVSVPVASSGELSKSTFGRQDKPGSSFGIVQPSTIPSSSPSASSMSRSPAKRDAALGTANELPDDLLFTATDLELGIMASSSLDRVNNDIDGEDLNIERNGSSASGTSTTHGSHVLPETAPNENVLIAPEGKEVAETVEESSETTSNNSKVASCPNNRNNSRKTNYKSHGLWFAILPLAIASILLLALFLPNEMSSTVKVNINSESNDHKDLDNVNHTDRTDAVDNIEDITINKDDDVFNSIESPGEEKLILKENFVENGSEMMDTILMTNASSPGSAPSVKSSELISMPSQASVSMSNQTLLLNSESLPPTPSLDETVTQTSTTAPPLPPVSNSLQPSQVKASDKPIAFPTTLMDQEQSSQSPHSAAPQPASLWPSLPSTVQSKYPASVSAPPVVEHTEPPTWTAKPSLASLTVSPQSSIMHKTNLTTLPSVFLLEPEAPMPSNAPSFAQPSTATQPSKKPVQLTLSVSPLPPAGSFVQFGTEPPAPQTKGPSSTPLPSFVPFAVSPQPSLVKEMNFPTMHPTSPVGQPNIFWKLPKDAENQPPNSTMLTNSTMLSNRSAVQNLTIEGTEKMGHNTSFPADAKQSEAHSGFSFFLMGDVPYSFAEQATLARQLDEIALLVQREDAEASDNLFGASSHNVEKMIQPPTFIVHVGDFGMVKRNNCRESYYKKIHSIFTSHMTLPIFATPGDNEWNDCPDPSKSPGLFATYYTSLATHIANPPYQLNLHRPSNHPENIVFLHQGILMFACNLVGGQTHSQEWFDRIDDNVDFVLEHAKSYHGQYRCVLIFGHSFRNPFLVGIKNWFKSKDVDVIYFHGDGHVWDWKEGQYDDWPQFLMVQVDQGGKAPPILVKVRGEREQRFEGDGKNLFSFGEWVSVDRRGGLYDDQT